MKPIFVIFSTVFLDLIGFGMIIPLVAIYGKHFGATGFELALLGSIYSIFQFFFSPFWGKLSDRIGRRPVLLVSLFGSSASYFLFALAHDFGTYALPALIFSRALAGFFAANISAAQAYIADITPPQDRAKGMGLIGAAFGIGFTLGPPIGGIAAAKLGLSFPGWIAGTLCALNLLMAYFRLEESLTTEIRAKNQELFKNKVYGRWNQFKSFSKVLQDSKLALPVVSTFFATFAFSNLEQVFSLLIQSKFNLPVEQAGFQTGMILMWSGFLGALVQGGLIRRLVPKYGEIKLVIAGLILEGLAMLAFAHSPTYGAFFVTAIPLALGSGLINPSLASLVSKGAAHHEQGEVMGAKEGMSSLARIFGPFFGLLSFGINPHFPFYIAAATVLLLSLKWLPKRHQIV